MVAFHYFIVFVQITRRDDTIQQLEGDLDTSRKQLKDAIEEVRSWASRAWTCLVPYSAKRHCLNPLTLNLDQRLTTQ